jgi:hypothetical protein
MLIPLQQQKMNLKAKIFRGLGDSTRLSILECIRAGEKSNSQIVEEIGQTQSNVSNRVWTYYLLIIPDRGLGYFLTAGKRIQK